MCGRILYLVLFSDSGVTGKSVGGSGQVRDCVLYLYTCCNVVCVVCRECSELRYNYSFLKAEHGNVMVGGYNYGYGYDTP